MVMRWLIPIFDDQRRKTKSMRGLLSIVIVAVGLGGCSAHVIPMNPSAERLGPIEVSSIRMGAPRGPVTIKMGDGEILTGEYWGAFTLRRSLGFTDRTDVGSDNARDFGFSGHSPRRLRINDGPLHIVANGPRTQILCRGRSGVMGYGDAECQTLNGDLWAIYW
jgi:hypothetical protein